MTHQPIGNPETPYPPKQKPEIGDIYHLPTGTRVSKNQMLTAIGDSRIVYVGETHDNPAAHRLQLDVLQSMHKLYPGQISLGMEMFNTEQQGALDEWIQGRLIEKTFLKKSAWFSNWNMDFAYYRDLLTFARQEKIPVVALNATKDMVKTISTQPTDLLSPEVKAKLPEMDLNEPYQRAMTEAVFSGHKSGGKMIDGFHRVQTLWDETMAENIVRHLDEKGAQQRMVVIAGGNHVRHGFGIPRRVYRRLPTSYSLVGVREIEVPEEKQIRTMDIQMPIFPMVAYDYLNFVAYESLPNDKVKLGVRFKEDSGRILVEAVVPGSAADIAGLKAGDHIEFISERAINDGFDLVYEVSQKKEGDEVDLIIDREGIPQSIRVRFIPLPPPEIHGRKAHKQ